MYITKSRKYHKQADGSYTAYDYFRLTRKRYDASGKEKTEHFSLGQLEGLTKSERNELADMLTVMIERGERPLRFNATLNELAMDFYLKYRESRPGAEFDGVVRAEAEGRGDLVSVRQSSHVQKQARTIRQFAAPRSIS